MILSWMLGAVMGAMVGAFAVLKVQRDEEQRHQRWIQQDIEDNMIKPNATH